MLPALAILAAALLGRAAYPRVVERRQRRRRALDPNGIIVGAGPIDLPRANAPGALLIHGAGDTPQALAGLAEHLHANGFSVRVPLLTGHGRDLSALASVSASDWHRDVQTELEHMRAHHSRVGVVGLSMGGALALKIASERTVDALVLLAPYVDMPPLVRTLASTTRAWSWLLPYFSSRGSRSIRDPQAAARALGHGILTPAALRGLFEVMNDAASVLSRVECPTLVIQSREDNRILPESAELAFARLGSREKRFVWTSGAGHVISVDYGYPRVFELTADWLRDHTGPV